MRFLFFPFRVLAYIGMMRLLLNVRSKHGTPHSRAKRIYLNCKDFLELVPYTSWIHNREAVDPVSMVVWGLTPEELVGKIMHKDKSWHLIHKSYQSLCVQCTRVTSWTQIVKRAPDDDGHEGTRYHARFFLAYSDRGLPVTIGAMHLERDDGGHKIISWDSAREEVLRDLGLVPHMCRYVVEMTEPNWRKKPSDGRAVLLYFPREEEKS